MQSDTKLNCLEKWRSQTKFKFDSFLFPFSASYQKKTSQKKKVAQAIQPGLDAVFSALLITLNEFQAAQAHTAALFVVLSSTVIAKTYQMSPLNGSR